MTIFEEPRASLPGVCPSGDLPDPWLCSRLTAVAFSRRGLRWGCSVAGEMPRNLNDRWPRASSVAATDVGTDAFRHAKEGAFLHAEEKGIRPRSWTCYKRRGA